MVSFWRRLLQESCSQVLYVEYGFVRTPLSGSFILNMHRKILIMKHSSCSFHDSSVLPFCNPILLWIIRSGQLPLNPESLHSLLNSFEVNSLPLSNRKVLIFFLVWFSIKDLNSLNLLNTSSLLFMKYIHVFLENH